MTTTARPQQRYDHRLRDLVQRTGDVTIAADLGVPRSTARGWLGSAPKIVISRDVTDLASVHGVVQNLFRVDRHLLRSVHHRLLRTRAFVEWDAVTCAC